jgi:hypothetical protein
VATLTFRSLKLPAAGLIAAIVVLACAPVGSPAGQVTPASIAEAPSTARPTASAPLASHAAAPSATSAPTVDPGPSGDAVTGGVAGPVASAPPAAASTRPPAAQAQPTATPRPTAAANAEPFAMNLYRKGDFVAQYTFEWCVGASLQMALNMATDAAHTSRADQQRLWEMARDRSFSPFGGANPIGWTAVLNEVGIGPYELVSVPTLDEALTTAAEAIRATKRPVGLVMWRGRHAWVMSGFESTADPRKSDAFDVTGIRVQDPLYPNGSSVWGRSPRPNSLVSPATLAKQFVVRDVTRSRVNLGVPTGYLMIVPVDAAA